MICAALSWFDEKPEMLTACVESLQYIADYIVAVDGPYDAFPYRDVKSATEQHEAIRMAANQINVPCAIWETGLAWSSQQAKRDVMCDFVMQTKQEWMLVIDADERVSVSSGDLKPILNRTDHDVAMVADGRSGMRRLFRCVPDLSVRIAHNGYFGNDRWLGGVKLDDGHEWATPEMSTMYALVIAHDRDARDYERLKEANRYLIERNRRGER